MRSTDEMKILEKTGIFTENFEKIKIRNKTHFQISFLILIFFS